MKNILFLMLISCVSGTTLCAQIPDQFHYQAVLKFTDGNALNTWADFRFTVVQGSPNGAVVYKEQHDGVFVEQGLLTIRIGAGQALDNTQWTNVDWSNGTKYLKVEVKPFGDPDFTTMGDPQPLASVPFAQESKKALIASNLVLPYNATAPFPGALFTLQNGASKAQLATGVDAALFSGLVTVNNPNGDYGLVRAGADPNAYLELRGGTPYIDFSEGSSGDWGARILYYTTSGVPFDIEQLQFQANSHKFTGVVSIEGNSGSNSPFVPYNYFYGPETGNFPPDNQGYTTSEINPKVSLTVSDRVRAAGFQAVSDARIKTVLGSSDPVQDLATLRNLRVADYTHIDVVSKGRKAQKGFIAQEVEQVFPEAVARSMDFIPNIYCLATQVHHDDALESLTVQMNTPHGLVTGDRVRLIADQTYELEVAAVEENFFVVKGWTGPAPEKVFVYGKEVLDFRSVDYDRIFTLNVSATQELARQVQVLQAENAALQAENEAFMAQLGRLASQVDALTTTSMETTNETGSHR